MVDFDIALLPVLRELAERGSVTAVAAATHRTPSAVSQQLRTLQRQAGVPLVERVGRGVRLTDHGRALAAMATGVATALATVEASWAEHLAGVTGTVDLAVFPSAAELLLPGSSRGSGSTRASCSRSPTSTSARASSRRSPPTTTS